MRDLSSPKVDRVLIALVGVVATLALIPMTPAGNYFDRVFTSRSRSCDRVCLFNLRQIDGAIATWQIENPQSTNTTPTWSDLVGEHGYIHEQPVCPEGGVYTLPKPGQKLTCSVKGHTF